MYFDYKVAICMPAKIVLQLIDIKCFKMLLIQRRFPKKEADSKFGNSKAPPYSLTGTSSTRLFSALPDDEPLLAFGMASP